MPSSTPLPDLAMTDHSPVSPDVERIRAQLAAASSADDCLSLAAEADAAGDVPLKQECLQRAVALDRFCQPALLNLAAVALDEDDAMSAYGLLEEAARVAPLPSEVAPLHEHLRSTLQDQPALAPYLRAIGNISVERADAPLSILVITGTFGAADPAPMGRSLEALVQGLIARGHTVRVLAGAASDEATESSPIERSLLMRRLQLRERAQGGTPSSVGQELPAQQTRDNIARVRTAVTKGTVELVLAADFDQLDISILRPALEREVPVIHLLATTRPPYSVDEQPREPHYAIAPASDWTGTALRNAGFETARMDTIYPATKVEEAFRLFLPDTTLLRICHGAPLRPGTGADVLWQALVALHEQGIPFAAEFAGPAADAEFLADLRAAVRERQLDEQVRFSGEGASAAVLARSNVFVSANQLPESFSNSQVEAMAAGVTVLASGAGGTKEIVRDGVDGLCFRPGDSADLARKLVSLAQEPDLMERLQRAGQSRAVSFSVQPAVQRIETLAAELREAVSRARLEAGFDEAGSV